MQESAAPPISIRQVVTDGSSAQDFVAPGSDYHLKAASLAIDHGVNAGVPNDRDGNPRPQGNALDLGAYEYPSASAGASTLTANPSSVPADGVQFSQLTVTILDVVSRPLAGRVVSLTVSA